MEQKNFKRTTVTAALPYANGGVHIGHLAGVYVPADIYVRYLRLKKQDVVFIGGSDEHGVPVTIRAKKEGITVGASQFYGKYLLVPMLDVLRSTASDHHVEIIEGSSDHLEEEILKGHLDMGFFPEPIHHEDINFVPIYEEEVYFAHAAENKDAAALIKHAWDGKSLNLAPFRDLPFIMLRKGLKFHDLTQRLCREYDFFPKAIYESDNLDTVYSLVSHNYGVAFLPSTLLPVLTKKDSNVRFYPLASKNAQRRIGIAYLGTRFKEKKMQALAKEIRNRLLGAQILPS